MRLNVCDNDGYTALHYAVMSEDITAVKTLLSAGWLVFFVVCACVLCVCVEVKVCVCVCVCVCVWR